MTKIISNSSSASIKKWAYQKSNQEPLPNWNQLITTLENADLLLSLVADVNCPQRAYLLKCLYSLVGTSVSRHAESDIAQIKVLLSKVASSEDQVILNWVSRSRVILRDLRKYDYVEWCNGGFAEKDLATVVQKN